MHIAVVCDTQARPSIAGRAHPSAEADPGVCAQTKRRSSVAVAIWEETGLPDLTDLGACAIQKTPN